MEQSSDLQSSLKLFNDYLVGKKRARATIIAYTKDIEQLTLFMSHIGKKGITTISQEDIEAFLQKLRADNYTPKSVSRKINSIKTFFRFLKTQGIIQNDPATDIEHPKYEIKPPRVLSKIEYRALRDACRADIRTYAIVELFLQTGIRIGELTNLTLGDVQENTLHIAQQEGHEERTVPLNKAAKEALNRYLDIRTGPKESTAPLFITKSGKALLIRNIRTSIDRYFRAAGIEDAKVNDLRHTFITHHLMAGTPITTLSKLVGHKRLSTTEKYMDLIKDKQIETVKLEEL
jgi:site-specific recombinase XerD